MICVRRQNALILLVVFVYAFVVTPMRVSAAPPEKGVCLQSAHAGNSLTELHGKRRALLVVFRSRMVDVSPDGERAIIEDVLRADPRPRGRFRRVYLQLAQKLNNYMREYQSIDPANSLADADYVIYFNVVEFRRILNTPYPYGELFVIVKGSPEQLKPPRIVWRANKVLFVEDAIGNLIKELKAARGES